MTSTQTKLLPPPHFLAANQTQATVGEANHTRWRKGMEKAGTAGHKPGTPVPKCIQTSTLQLPTHTFKAGQKPKAGYHPGRKPVWEITRQPGCGEHWNYLEMWSCLGVSHTSHLLRGQVLDPQPRAINIPAGNLRITSPEIPGRCDKMRPLPPGLGSLLSSTFPPLGELLSVLAWHFLGPWRYAALPVSSWHC